MIGLVMAGGRGSRMGGTAEKLTLGYAGAAVLGVVEALECSGAIHVVVAAVSSQAPRTRTMLEGRADTLDTPGDGYSADLAYALDRLHGPALVVPGDLPLLDGPTVAAVARAYDPSRWISVLITERYAARMGVSPGIGHMWNGRPCRYTGISVVDADAAPDAPQHYTIMDRPGIALNLNTNQDLALLGAAYDFPEQPGL